MHLFGGNYDLNQLDPKFFSLGLTLQDQVPNPYFGQITTGALAGPTVARSQLLRPFPDYQSIGILANHGASSTYHSFQFTAERRYSNGLSALVSYTNSKLIDDSFSIAGGGGGSGDFRIGRLNRAQDRAIDEEDISQRLVFSAVYELPFGKGRRFLKDGVISHVVGGWLINTITTLQTGRPLKVRGANNFTGINWPDMVCDPTLDGGQRSAECLVQYELLPQSSELCHRQRSAHTAEHAWSGLQGCSSVALPQTKADRKIQHRIPRRSFQRVQLRQLRRSEHDLYAERAGRQHQCELRQDHQFIAGAQDSVRIAVGVLRALNAEAQRRSSLRRRVNQGTDTFLLLRFCAFAVHLLFSCYAGLRKSTSKPI